MSTPEYDPEAIVDGLGCTERNLNAYLDWAESQPVAEPEVEPEAERLVDTAADLGHDYEGRELQVGTPEYEQMAAEYQEWTNSPHVEAEELEL
jgi:hypothetical protein